MFETGEQRQVVTSLLDGKDVFAVFAERVR